MEVLGPLEPVRGREAVNGLLMKALADDGKAEFVDLFDAFGKDGTAALERFFLGRIDNIQ